MAKPMQKQRQYNVLYESPVVMAGDIIADYIMDPRLGPGQRQAAIVCAWLAMRDLPKDLTFEEAFDRYAALVNDITGRAAEIYRACPERNRKKRQ